MSITLFYSQDRGFNIGSATAINEFVNEVAKLGSYPSIVLRDFNEGMIHFADAPIDLDNTNLTATIADIEDLSTKPMSTASTQMLEILRDACNYAKENELDLEFA
jgi:hypothetical protein